MVLVRPLPFLFRITHEYKANRRDRVFDVGRMRYGLLGKHRQLAAAERRLLRQRTKQPCYDRKDATLLCFGVVAGDAAGAEIESITSQPFASRQPIARRSLAYPSKFGR